MQTIDESELGGFDSFDPSAFNSVVAATPGCRRDGDAWHHDPHRFVCVSVYSEDRPRIVSAALAAFPHRFVAAPPGKDPAQSRTWVSVMPDAAAQVLTLVSSEPRNLLLAYSEPVENYPALARLGTAEVLGLLAEAEASAQRRVAPWYLTLLRCHKIIEAAAAAGVAPIDALQFAADDHDLNVAELAATLELAYGAAVPA